MRIYIAPSNQEHNIGVGNYGTEEERMNQLADKLIDGLHELKDVEVFRNTLWLSRALDVLAQGAVVLSGVMGVVVLLRGIRV
jgi:hypothetical protein